MSNHETLAEGTYFTMYPNHLLEAIGRSNMTKTQIKICNHIIRQTFGWHRNWGVIAQEDFVDACATSRQSISRQLQELIDKKVVIPFGKKLFQTTSYRMNTDIDTWDPDIFDSPYSNDSREYFKPKANDPLRGMGDHSQGVVVYSSPPKSFYVNPDLHEVVCYSAPPNAHPGLHVHANTNLHEEATSDLEHARLQKSLNKTLKKNKRKSLNIYSEEDEESKLAKLLYNCIQENFPGYEEPDIQKWSDVMRKMIRFDKRDPESIEKAIYFARQDEYWHKNVLTPEELRGRYDFIEASMLQHELREKKTKAYLKLLESWD